MSSRQLARYWEFNELCWRRPRDRRRGRREIAGPLITTALIIAAAGLLEVS
jgi:hypothetical protein